MTARGRATKAGRAVERRPRPARTRGATGVPAALGFSVHSGWAALVALAGDPRAPRVVLRERIEMADPEHPESRQPYHAAEGLDLEGARRLLKGFADTARRLARLALGRVSRDLRRSGCVPRSSGILQAAGRLPRRLDEILASHAFIHTADGVHFREALAHASERNGWAVTRIPGREALGRAAETLGTSAADLQARVEAMGRPLGPPWTADQKHGALAAWFLLASAAPSDRSNEKKGPGPAARREGPDSGGRIR